MQVQFLGLSSVWFKVGGSGEGTWACGLEESIFSDATMPKID